MDNNVFREKSIDQISSTEELRDYMHVTSPRMWMILSAILLMVIGMIVFASTITMENSIYAKATVAVDTQDGEQVMDISVKIPKEAEELVKPGMPAVIAGEKGKIESVYSFLETNETESVLMLYDKNKILKPGTYDVKIILERISPISFLFN